MKMRISKKLIGALLSSTATISLGAIALTSCGEQTRMMDVEDLLTNGYTRKTECAQPEQISLLNATKWYFNKIGQNKEILREDFLTDSFPKKTFNEEIKPEASGETAIEIKSIDKQHNRLSFDIIFNGTVKNLFVPWLPFLTKSDLYLYANIQVKIQVRKVRAKVYRTPWNTWKMCSDYFKDDGKTFDPKDGDDIDFDKITSDQKWSVNLQYDIKGGAQQTPYDDVEVPDDFDKDGSILFKYDFKREGETKQEALQAMAKAVARATIKNLEFMKNIDVW